MTGDDTKGSGPTFVQAHTSWVKPNGVGTPDMPRAASMAAAFNAGVASAVESRVSVDFGIRNKK